MRLKRRATLWIAGIVMLAGHSSSRAQLAYESSVSLSLGAYAASGFGTNTYFGGRYNYFINGGKIFIEGALGFGSLKSKVLESVTKSQIFDTERLYSYEFVGGYDPFPNGAVPYFVFGVAGLNQGGQTNFAGVLGLGKRVPLRGMFGSDQFGFRYDVRDQIFSQKLKNDDSFIAHNIAFTLGLQLYF
jgi:hypothetical protein